MREDRRLLVLLTMWTAVAALVLGVVIGVFVMRQTLLLALPLSPPPPVCHALTEDSVITDCTYRDRAWKHPS